MMALAQPILTMEAKQHDDAVPADPPRRHGHDAQGRAVVLHDGPLASGLRVGGHSRHRVPRSLVDRGQPGAVDNGPDPTPGPPKLPPPPEGTRIRFVDIPPDTADFLRDGAVRMQQAFGEIGDAAASTVRADSPHPLMHRTESVDYGVVIAGELTLVLDDSEVQLTAGSVVVQRGTNHAWANRSGAPCRMLFVLVGGRYAPDVRAALALADADTASERR